jgi:hypothetical protein
MQQMPGMGGTTPGTASPYARPRTPEDQRALAEMVLMMQQQQPEMASLERQQRMAEQLSQGGLGIAGNSNPIQAGRLVVARSPLERMGGLAQQAVGDWRGRRSDTRAQEMGAERGRSAQGVLERLWRGGGGGSP